MPSLATLFIILSAQDGGELKRARQDRDGNQ